CGHTSATLTQFFPTWTEIVGAIIPICLVLPRKKLRSVKAWMESAPVASKSSVLKGLPIWPGGRETLLLSIYNAAIMIAKRYMQAVLTVLTLVCLAGAQELRHISNEEARTHLTKQVEPNYPQLAQIAHIQGVVNLEITITEDGNVTDRKGVSGHPILV